MRILVTGGAGFIGSHVVDALAGLGHEVVVVDVAAQRNGARGVYVGSDLRDFYVPKGNGFDAVVHLAAFGGVARAARDPRNLFEANAVATMHLVEQVRRHMPLCRRVVHVSSFSVYGRAYPVTEETPTDPLELYAASKLAQELAFKGSGLPLTILRCSSVYGRRMRVADPEATILAKIAGWVARGEPVTLHEDGYQTRDFVHVTDVVAAIRNCIDQANLAPRLVNVCSGKPVTLHHAATVVSHIVGKPARVECSCKARPGDMRHCGGDPKGLTTLLGREPTTFELGAIDAFAELAA